MIEQINEDLKQAMRERDSLKVNTLKSLKTALKNAEIANKGQLDQQTIILTLKRASKQRREAADAYQLAGNSEQADKELSEKLIIEGYLPEQMTDEQITKVISDVKTELGNEANFGQIMSEVMHRTDGKADGRTVSKLVQNK